MRKTRYCDYEKLFSFRKTCLFLELEKLVYLLVENQFF